MQGQARTSVGNLLSVAWGVAAPSGPPAADAPEAEWHGYFERHINGLQTQVSQERELRQAAVASLEDRVGRLQTDVARVSEEGRELLKQATGGATQTDLDRAMGAVLIVVVGTVLSTLSSVFT